MPALPSLALPQRGRLWPASARAFTWTDLLIVLALLAVVALLVLPALTPPARPLPRATFVRGVHQAALVFAQDNHGYLPGLTADGEIATGLNGLPADDPRSSGAHPAARLWLLLQGEYISADLAISAAEPTPVKWTTGAVTTANYSYAFLEINGARRRYWRDAGNAQALMLSDRDLGPANGFLHQSLLNHSTFRGRKRADWRGYLVWGDNHAELAQSPLVTTDYGGAPVDHDDIFIPSGTNDAWMIHEPATEP